MVKLLPKAVLITVLVLTLSACAGQNRETRQMTLRERIGNAYGVTIFPG